MGRSAVCGPPGRHQNKSQDRRPPPNRKQEGSRKLTGSPKVHLKKEGKPAERGRRVGREEKFRPVAGLTQCSVCSRNFNADRIDTHRNICKKTTNKRRKPFNVQKARIEGTDAANFFSKSRKKAEKVGKGGNIHLNFNPSQRQPSTNWRKKREEFVRTLRAAREAQRLIKKGCSTSIGGTTNINQSAAVSYTQNISV